MSLTADQRYLALKFKGTHTDGLKVYGVDCETYVEDFKHFGIKKGYHTDGLKVYEMAICESQVNDVEIRQKAKFLGTHDDGLAVYAANCCGPCKVKICVTLLTECRNVPTGVSYTIQKDGDPVCSGPMGIYNGGDGEGYARICCEVAGVSGISTYNVTVFHTTPNYEQPTPLTFDWECGEKNIVLVAPASEGYACCGCQRPGADHCTHNICPTWDHIYITDRYGTHTLPLVDNCNGCRYEVCINPTEPTSRKMVQCWTDPYQGYKGYTLQETGGIINLKYVAIIRCGYPSLGEDPDLWYLEVTKHLAMISTCQDDNGDPCCPGKNNRDICWCEGNEPATCHSYIYGDVYGYPRVLRIADISDCTSPELCNCGYCYSSSTQKKVIASPCDGGVLNESVHFDDFCPIHPILQPDCGVPDCVLYPYCWTPPWQITPFCENRNYCIGGDSTAPNSGDDLTITS